ncbi:MAG: tetratricopeptide repeat protein [Gemmataceae bacterium]|nr:tetratricopeptide repeat protein [Gemmataceae bacterium]
MKIVEALSLLSLQPLIDGAGTGGGSSVREFWGRQSTDNAARFLPHLKRSLDQAWKTVEVALAGPAWWERCKVLLQPGEDTAIGERVQAFLDSVALPDPAGEWRGRCLSELPALRQRGLLSSEALRGESLSASLQAAGADTERQALDQIAADLRQASCSALAEFVAQRFAEEIPLLTGAARYFLRREIEADADLAQQMASASITLPASVARVRFDALGDVLAQHGPRLDVLLTTVGVAAAGPRGYPLDIEREVQGQEGEVLELAEATLTLLTHHRLRHRELTLADSGIIRGEAERQRIKDLSARFQALEPEQQQRLPALLNGLATLEAMAGDYETAHRYLQGATTVVTDPHARAVLDFNAYQVALEQHDWAEALTLLERAVTLWPERFSLFPTSKYEAERILGVGGSGVAFLCRHRASDSYVVVKALWTDGLRHDAAEVFREAQAIELLDHPAIVRLRDCDFADTERTRPFIVTDFFEGLSLAEHVQQHGPLTGDDWLRIARPLAEALLAAHEQGILHRDVKPANVLLRKEENGSWRVKLIDFGLALRPIVLHATLTSTSIGGRSAIGASAAGSVPYASPEEIGWLEGVPVGAYSDIYSFGKTGYFALLGTPEPDDEEKATLPPGWRKVLGYCSARSIARRMPSFKTVLERISQLQAAAARETPAEKKEPGASPHLSRPDAEKVVALVNRGMAYRQQGDYEHAIAAFTRALQIDPNLTAAHIKRGNVYSDRGDYDRAMADYTAALKLDPKMALAYLNRGLAHAKKGEFDAVIADCTAAIDLDPKLAAAYFIRGTAYSSKGERHRAIAEFNLALRLDPKNPLVYNDRGMAYADQGDFDRALVDYTAALRLDPRLTLVYVNRGIAFHGKANYDRAIAEFTRALRLEPRNVPAYFNRGLAFAAKAAHPQAIADFDKVLLLDPKHTEAAAKREESQRARGKVAAPVGAERRPPTGAPRVPTRQEMDERRLSKAKNTQEEERRQVRAAAYFARGRSYFEAGEYGQAIDQFTKAIQMDPRDAVAYFNRGLAYVAQTEYQEAIADYTSALHLNPRNAMAYYHRGIAHRLLGEYDRAIADYTRAIRLDGRLAMAYRNRGQAYAAKGDSERAQADYEEAGRIDPNLGKK